MADGLKTAIAIMGNHEAPPTDDAHQLGMIEEADAPLPLDLVDRTVSAPSGKGGRPKGAINRSTRQWVEYIASRYRSPLIGLAETWSRPVAELARELGLYQRTSTGQVAVDHKGEPLLNLMEAFKLQQSAMLGALPYLHSRMPLAVQVQQKSNGVLILGDLGADARTDVLTLGLADYEEKQEVSEEPAAKSHEEKVA